MQPKVQNSTIVTMPLRVESVRGRSELIQLVPTSSGAGRLVSKRGPVAAEPARHTAANRNNSCFRIAIYRAPFLKSFAGTGRAVTAIRAATLTPTNCRAVHRSEYSRDFCRFDASKNDIQVETHHADFQQSRRQSESDAEHSGCSYGSRAGLGGVDWQSHGRLAVRIVGTSASLEWGS